jgi:hypothetical protein
MDAGKAQHCGGAARWLGKARAAYLAIDRTPEPRTYHARLLDHHRRKYTLTPLLKALK